MAHAITLKSDLGDGLLFVRMQAHERLGHDFRYELRAISQDSTVDLGALLGRPMSVTVKEAQGYTRHFHGIVAEAAQAGFQVIQDLRYAVYEVTLVPKPWLLRHGKDCRIFKNQSVPEIVRTVLAEIGYTDVRLGLGGSYPPREYCVQYRESGFDFISRLMEQEGIYYYFTHSAATHTMVLADALGAHAAAPSFERIPYCPPGQKGSRMKDSITDWETARSIDSNRVQLTDYDWLRPKASLLATEEAPDAVGGSGIGDLDVFDYPGEHVTVADGQRYARVRAEALGAAQSQYRGHTDACGLAVGALFTLKDFPLAEYNQEYLVTQTEIELVEVDYVSGDAAARPPFSCRFTALPSRQPFRSLPTAPRPVIAGLQTAVVQGDTAEDIAVDKYGRVQVTFFWNAPDKPKAQTSCPVRVASSWAGKRWGAVQIPRVGQEVVVSFLEGNPDRPLIIGSVYNADNMPPYALPENKTRSGVKSRSHLGGAEDYNEIRFEDKKGSEELLLHAQKDLRHEVENDHFATVDGNETAEIKRERTHTIGGDDTLKVGRTLRIEAGSEIELVTGAARLVMKRTGEIELSGTRLTFDGQVSVDMNAGVMTNIGAGANLTIKSNAALLVNANAAAVVRSMGGLLLNATGPAVLKGLPPIIG
ncbi:type VI secretion system Vgr family protein [Pseudoxanthomonas putridarboris]|uniref:Type VI secretion system tip protein TssI/VgrG n=1 Tax=Pseudoxanthomonas putridarboris TaxID=752605 RepID=A0ABU9J376_9GAMM